MATTHQTVSTPAQRLTYNNAAITNTRTGHTSINRSQSAELRKVSGNDRLYISLSLRGNTIAELSLVGMTSLTDIISQLRYLAAKYRGLAQMYVRNMTAGWSMQRPLMLYN